MPKDTQLQAYEFLHDTIAKKNQQVLEAIKKNKGATLFQLVEILGWPVNRISGRVTELAALGIIKDSGTRRMNPATGRSAVVWETTKHMIEKVG